MQIERKGNTLVITCDVSPSTVANGHTSSTGKNWVIDAAKLQSGEIVAQVSVYQKKAPALAGPVLGEQKAA